MQDQEFYIGWNATAPPSFARVIRRVVIVLGLAVPALALCLVYFQNGFSNGIFDYGKTTVLEGVFTNQPVPFLTIENGKDAANQPVFQKILLVGQGKFGFYGVPELAENRKIKVTGFLIYNDGRTAFQVESVALLPDNAIQNDPVRKIESQITNQSITLRGEIADPKCLLGVMNPAQGKPHRDCAVRCIAGGLPPVLKVANEAGDTEYYLIVGPAGEPLNNQVLQFVGDAVQIYGRLEQQGDWYVLYADPTTLQRIGQGLLHSGAKCN